MPKKARTSADKALQPAVKREAFWITAQHMARSCGISPQAFRQWGVEPVAKIGANAFYLVSAVIANRLENHTAKTQKRDAPLSDYEFIRSEREEKLRLTKAQAEGQEIKNAQLREELAPVDIIEWVIGKTGAQISAILDALPSQIKKRCPKLTASGIELIRREIVKAQNAAAHANIDLDEYYEREADK